MKKDAPGNEVTQTEENSVFALGTLRQNCRKLFHVSDSTFAGATHSLDPNKCYSVDDVRKQLDNWMKRRIK